ncbi:alpha/beta hydrolase-fold protein [Amaricoccus sp.]|uniref:esterase family protein n=1 Tax=Amaricoccus sp. TaxID=1872485 RepID=UPI002611D580|nr:alpha/beta hydrolase-fold protein [Amaricoccus sp.]HRO12831.1 alpha/beta hydrolase-fold protein [Amaricoccus sp.]
MKQASRWYSERIEQEITLVRWGHWGQPVLVFPTAGGDAEEIERMQLVGALMPLIEGGRIKVYSCDNLAGRAFAARTGSVEYRCALLNRFEECVAEEVVPAIRADCRDGGAEVAAAGASLGAFMAVAVAARYPWAFRAAVGMSGSYDLERVFEFKGNDDYYFSTPMSFLPNLGGGAMLDLLRRRFFVLAYGGGRWENPEDSWRLAGILGAKGIPNRVDPWGPEYDHDWPTWRKMLPLYLDDLVA